VVISTSGLPAGSALLAGSDALTVHGPVSLFVEEPPSAQAVQVWCVAVGDCFAQHHVEEVPQGGKGVPLHHGVHITLAGIEHKATEQSAAAFSGQRNRFASIGSCALATAVFHAKAS